MMEAFRKADEVLLSGVEGITKLITTPGVINVDFADVRSVMTDAGSALMGIGTARGESRAIKATESAINSPLLESTMKGAKGVLLSFAGGSDLGLMEVSQAATLVEDLADEDANIIFGTIIDDQLGDEVRVTVIATGFDDSPSADSRDQRNGQQRPSAAPTQSATIFGGEEPAQPSVSPLPQHAVEQPAEQSRHAQGGYGQQESRPSSSFAQRTRSDVPRGDGYPGQSNGGLFTSRGEDRYSNDRYASDQRFAAQDDEDDLDLPDFR